MLEPHDRRLLLDALRPPIGYRLDEGIGTTFSLDLLALLTAPLGFTMLELQDSQGADIGESDALLLLKTIREYAGRLTVYCQAGRIAVPRGQAPLLASLEQSVVEVTAPKGGVFHPKVWALRYVGDGLPVHYRVLVLSRNLTFDRSWDTMLVLDGVLRDRTNAISKNHPLGALFDALPNLAVGELTPISRERALRFGYELRRVEFGEELPPGVTDLAFHALGLQDRPQSNPFAGRIDRLMVVSPFVSASALGKLCDPNRNDVLVSRSEELAKLPPSLLENLGQVLVLNPSAVESDEADADASVTETQDAGLHAKLYVADAGWDARVWTGSANATIAAMNRNVEFLVELTGKKKDFGIEALLSLQDSAITLRSLLIPFAAPDQPVPTDDDDVSAEEALETARLTIGAVGWVAQATPAEEGHDLVLAPRTPFGQLSAIDEIRAYPVMLPESSAREALEGHRFVFPGLSTTALTSFFAFDISVRVGHARKHCRFVVNAELRGAPEDRRELLLRSLLRDRRQVIRFLLLLLADDDQVIHGEIQLGPCASGSAGRSGGTDGAEHILETLLRTLYRNPERLDVVAAFLRDIEKTDTPDGQLVPPRLKELLEPILAARGAAV